MDARISSRFLDWDIYYSRCCVDNNSNQMTLLNTIGWMMIEWWILFEAWDAHYIWSNFNDKNFIYSPFSRMCWTAFLVIAINLILLK